MAVRFQIPPEWSQLSENDRIEVVCRVFEQAWRQGADQRIEDYLESTVGVAGESVCIRLCALERRLRQERQQDLALSECLQRFPQHEAALIRHFGEDESANATVDSTITFAAGPGLDAKLDSQRPEERKIGRYILEQLLGRGAFGEVWRASDPMLNRKVAVKYLRTDRPVREGASDRFLNEARRLALLDHPSIVRVYDVGLQEGVPYIVSQLIDGETLGERMRRTAVSHDDAARIVAQISEAAHAAHVQGIVHRDIKPSNIILDSRGKAFLADFGLAITEEEQLHEPAGMLGTYAYMSPEQLRGQSNRTDARADVYSLGAVLYRLLTGRPLFVAGTPEQYREQALSREVRPPRTVDDSIPESLEQICLRCLNRDVMARFTTARDLANALSAAVGIKRPTAWSKRRIALSSAAVVLAAFGTWQLIGKLPAHTNDDNVKRGLVPSSQAPLPNDEPVIPRREPPSLGDMEVVDDAYLITPVVWTFSGLPADWWVRDKGRTLRAECGGAALIVFARLGNGDAQVEFDLGQRRWVGGTGIAYDTHTGDGDDAATTSFETLNIGPRVDGSWVVSRVVCYQANARPSDGWSTKGIEVFPIDRPNGDTMPVKLTFHAGRLTELVLARHKFTVSPSTSGPENDSNGNSFGLPIRRADASISNLTINGRRVRFRARQ